MFSKENWYSPYKLMFIVQTETILNTQLQILFNIEKQKQSQ